MAGRRKKADFKDFESKSMGSVERVKMLEDGGSTRPLSVFPGIPVLVEEDADPEVRERKKSQFQIHQAVGAWAGESKEGEEDRGDETHVGASRSRSSSPQSFSLGVGKRLKSMGSLELPLPRRGTQSQSLVHGQPFPGLPVFSEGDVAVAKRERVRNMHKIDRTLEDWAGAPLVVEPRAKRKKKTPRQSRATVPDWSERIRESMKESQGPFPGIPVYSEAEMSLEKREEVKQKHQIEKTIEEWAGFKEGTDKPSREPRHRRSQSLSQKKKPRVRGGDGESGGSVRASGTETFPGIILHSEEDATLERRAQRRQERKIERSIEDWAGKPAVPEPTSRSLLALLSPRRLQGNRTMTD